MKTKKLYFITQAAMIAAIYIGIDGASILYPRCSAGTFYRMSVKQSADRSHASGRDIWQSGDTAWCTGQLCIEKAFLHGDTATGDRQYDNHPICTSLCIWD